ncbi:hypothetical protein [Eleftheria terrae]|uniref:hypothetical protein n=1 Tax=Eleftheria terrae TaxID=1597781 RepID=UPI00263AF498|nr:hypothetical protein [Eleftheria terrae]WKB53408.1 hypothetical protein N7L95_03130 [Eleftheria terrae]
MHALLWPASLPMADIIAVDAGDEIRSLVEECRYHTGLPGRQFVITGAERLAYWVVAHASGFEVTRLDEQGRAMGTAYVSARAFDAHVLAQAQQCGCLYTIPLPDTLGDTADSSESRW